MKTITEYINEAKSPKLSPKFADALVLKYDIDPLDYYVYMQDELDEDASDAEIDKWIDSEIEQIIIDLHCIDTSVIKYTNSKEYKQFIKLFTKEYKNKPYYNIALRFFAKLDEARD